MRYLIYIKSYSHVAQNIKNVPFNSARFDY